MGATVDDAGCESRRNCFSRIARVLCAALIGLGVVAVAGAQGPARFPFKPIRFMVPFPPGGPLDVTARTLGQRLAESLGQPVVIYNQPGAATIIGTDLVAKAPPDGHTWLLVPNTIAINVSVYKKLPYDTLRDLAPVTMVMRTSFVLVVHPSLPVFTVRDFIELAKAHPGELLYSSAGIGSGNHFVSVQFNMATNISTTHVPYKGTSPALVDLTAGRVHYQFLNPLGSLPLVRAGKLRALGAGTAKRLAIMPELPTIAESGVPGFETSPWFGIFTTGGTPREVVNRVQTEVARALALPDVKQTLLKIGTDLVGNTPDEFTAYFKSDITKWAVVVKAAGVKQK